MVKARLVQLEKRALLHFFTYVFVFCFLCTRFATKKKRGGGESVKNLRKRERKKTRKMVRYGGPRFEFFFTHQFLNNEMLIKKEDAQRVAFIKRERDKKIAQEEERIARERRAEEELRRVEEEAEAAKRYAVERIEARRQQKAQRRRRFDDLTRPLPRGPGAGRSGRLPARCADSCYMPGVDRHRIVPLPPAPYAHRPWIGGGTAWCEAEAKEKEELRYYCGAPKRSADETADEEKKVYVDGIERHHTRCVKKASEMGAKEENDTASDAMLLPALPQHMTQEKTERSPSVFSHGSSNAPIKALGTKHMDTITTKSQVQEHLERYGGALVPPRRDARPVTPFDNMTLPELAARLVRMQQRLHV